MSNYYTEPLMVSVYCMTYNQENTIAQAIESVLSQQTSFPFELIIHDDASTDRTTAIVKRYAAAYPDKIKAIIQKENQFKKCNIIKTFIHPVAKGDLIAICEGDDYWTDTNKLQLQYDYMTAHPECMLCFHAVEQLENDGKMMMIRPLKRSCEVSAELMIKRGGMFCPSVASMFRKEVMDNWPQFRDHADVYDYPAQVLAADMGTVYYLDQIMAVYRFASAGSWTSQHKDRVDFSHIENETSWLNEFDLYTGRKYKYAIRYHMAHMWFNEYRKTFDAQVRKNAWQYVVSLPLKDRLMFVTLIVFFTLFGRCGNKLFQVIKKLLLK